MSLGKDKIKHIYAKSANKTNNKDFYFPALSAKANINFPNKKNLFFRQKSKDIVSNQEVKIEQKSHQNNPQTNILNQKQSQNSFSSNSLKQMLKSQRKSSHLPKKATDNLNKSALYFTKRQLDMLQQKSIEYLEKRSQIQQKMIQKRQSFLDFKKKKEIIKEEQKMKILLDIQTKRQERQRNMSIRQRQRRQEKVFLHEQNIAKIDMQRSLKFRNKHQQLNLTKQIYIQTQDNSHFLKMQDFKARKTHMGLLESRLVFLMSNKIKNNQDEEDYLTQKMTSRIFYGKDSMVRSKSKEKQINDQ